MKREFQIRTTEIDGTEECLCFESLTAAQAHYEALVTSDPPYELECELLEVLEQATIYPSDQEKK